MVSTGFSSGEREGRKIRVMFFGTTKAGVVCQPARSSSRTAWAPLATLTCSNLNGQHVSTSVDTCPAMTKAGYRRAPRV